MTKMADDSLKKKLKEIIVTELNLTDVVPEDIADDELLFGEKFGLDSIDAVELVFQVKNHFGVEIKNMNEGREILQSINTLSHYIIQRLSS